MTDDLDPSRLLASAALDDEVTADERAQVDASAALRDEIAIYRDLRDQLRDVEVADGARESGIAAALAAFDARGADAVLPTVRAAAVVALGARRQRQSRWLGGAAAAAVFVVLVLVAFNAGTGSDSKMSSATTPAIASLGSAAKSPQTEAAPSAAADANAATAAATADTTAASTGATAAAELPAPGSATDTAAGGSATTPAPPADDPWATAPSINTEPMLVAFATNLPSPLLSSAQPATTVGPDANATQTSTAGTTAGTTADSVFAVGGVAGSAAYSACVSGSGLPSAPAVYMGDRVIVQRDDAAGLIRVIEPFGCVIRTSLVIPTP